MYRTPYRFARERLPEPALVVNPCESRTQKWAILELVAVEATSDFHAGALPLTMSRFHPVNLHGRGSQQGAVVTPSRANRVQHGVQQGLADHPDPPRHQTKNPLNTLVL